MLVEVDNKRCTGCCTCELMASHIFSVSSKTIVTADTETILDNIQLLRNVIYACPANAITVFDTEE